MSRLGELAALDEEAAVRSFLDCCGSTRWARCMAQARPFATRDQLHASANAAFDQLVDTDWLEAFAAHPRIGEAPASGKQSAHGQRWSQGEQAAASGASDEDRAALALGNHQYFARFGYSFIVCATGRSAAELRASLERRLAHGPEDELAVAAAEQRRITALRLDKMVAP